MKNKWYIKRDKSIGKIDGLSPLLLQLLSNRGLTEEKSIKSFLYGGINDLEEPFLLKDMDRAVERIDRAVKNGERIIVYGDYDVDGITATALLYRYFKEVYNYQIDYYIPRRKEEGYGLNQAAVEEFIKKDYDLLLTVDCGISAHEEVKYSMSHGLDVIITDHHQAGQEIPPALAVIDPHRGDDEYPFKSLAGVGVAFKLCQALEYNKNQRYISDLLLNLLDLVALGTVADIVPLNGENRIIVREGLQVLERTGNIGLQKLIQITGLAGRQLNTGNLAFIIAPHLNAAGRMDSAEKCVELLITEDEVLAEVIALELRVANRERQELEEKILQEALEKVAAEINLEEEKAIVLAAEGWHPGVIGIVASRLVESYYRPVILIAIDEDGIGKASCRSIRNLNLYEALQRCSNYLETFGGHEMAAGLTIKVEKIEGFRKEFNRVLDEKLGKEDLIPEIELDLALDLESISQDFYEELALLEPYGVGNPRPYFLLSDVKIEKAYTVGKKGEHLKFTLENGLNGIAFDFGHQINDFLSNPVDLLFSLELNQWNGKSEIQINLKDWKIRGEAKDFPILYIAKDYIFADKRGCTDFIAYFQDLLYYRDKFIVYVNNLKYYRISQSKLGKERVFLAEKQAEYDEFQKAKEGILFFTHGMLDKLAGWQEDAFEWDLVFLSLPFSLGEMKRVLALVKHDSVRVHLLYSDRDLELNRKLIKARIPDDNYLRGLYRLMQKYKNEDLVLEQIRAEIAASCEEKMLNSLTIFEELNIINRAGNRILLLPEPGKKLDLSASISYNNNIKIVEDFDCFVKLALGRDLFVLIDKLKSCKEDMEWT
ncbi:MAG: single-stranded-DNA-specific exonuclease RecJ [Halanaerobiales bacterium]